MTMLSAPAVEVFPGRRATRRWQRFITIAGLVLLGTLCSPLARIANYPAYPALELYHGVGEIVETEGLGNVLFGLLALVLLSAPYALGLCAACSAWWRPENATGRERSWADWLMCGYLVLLATSAVLVFVETRGPLRLGDDFPHLLLPAPACVIYLGVAVWRRRLLGVCATFAGALCLLTWLALIVETWVPAWNGSDGGMPGLYVLTAGALALLVGAFGEARAASGQSWHRVLLGLCLAGVRVARPANACQRCGYLLIGLPEPRCPECGLPFDAIAVQAVGTGMPPLDSQASPLAPSSVPRP